MRRLRVMTFALLIFTTGIASALHVSSPATIVTVPRWTYRGCYTDHVASRTLTAKKWTGNLTPGRCANICKGYRYFGLESSNECYCGNTVAPASIPTPDFFCENVCSGNPRAACGGPNVLSLYEANDIGSTDSPVTLLVSSNATAIPPKPAPPRPPPPRPPVVVNVPGWKYRGCWTDNPRERTLIAKVTRGYMTPQKCAEICKEYHFFGLEYSDECYCGNTISPSTSQAPENACSHVCMGDFGTICGGSNMISLYEAEYSDIAVS